MQNSPQLTFIPLPLYVVSDIRVKHKWVEQSEKALTSFSSWLTLKFIFSKIMYGLLVFALSIPTNLNFLVIDMQEYLR